jgi:hypothetical protein
MNKVELEAFTKVMKERIGAIIDTINTHYKILLDE